jgi:hypothetical protein
VFRSSGPRTRRPARSTAPVHHQAARRESALLGSVQLILAASNPSPADHHADRRDRLTRRRAEIIGYLQLQGGQLHARDGLVTRHLAAALGRSRDLHRTLRRMEADGMIVRDVRGRRTYSIRLVDGPDGAAPGDDARPSAPSHADFETFAEALLAIITKRLTVIDPDNRVRYEELDRYRVRLVEDLTAYRAMLRGRETCADPAAEHAFFDEKLAVMVARAREYEARNGFPFTDALTDTERQCLDRLVRAVDGVAPSADGG